MTDSKPYVSMSDLLQDKARLDALEQHLMHMSRISNPQIGGQTWGGQAHNVHRGDEAGPSYLRIYHHTIREVADMLLTAPPK
jgi:hypothetical protein